jgi:Neuraminidase (sialidase)
MRRVDVSLVLAAVGFGTLVLAASGATIAAPPAVLATGPSAFASCTVGGPGTNYPNSEVEPWVAVNPADPSNLIGVYQQDRWGDGGAHGLATAVSLDGGATWSHPAPPHFSTCAGGTPANGGDFDRASDPWVTFAPNGHAYQISLSVSTDQRTSAILVSKSTDRGLTWSEPATLIRETSDYNFNDKESITADPTSAARVYAVWDRSRKPGDANANLNGTHSAGFRGDIMFSRTTDGGATWSAPRDVLAGNSNQFTIGNQIAVLPDGTLIDIFNRGRGSGRQGSPNPFTIAVIRSTDHGDTWSDPITIAHDGSIDVRDPDTNAQVRAGEGLPDIAVDPTSGKLYAVWSDGRFSGGADSAVALSTSTDGGLTWSEPARVNLATPAGVDAFTPSVEVASDGTVGVSFYDFRSNTPAAGALADHFLVHSHDGGATWSETRLTPTSFDVEAAPVARGYFLGDYVGLAARGGSFVSLYVRANDGNAANPTDAYASVAG